MKHGRLTLLIVWFLDWLLLYDEGVAIFYVKIGFIPRRITRTKFELPCSWHFDVKGLAAAGTNVQEICL